MRLFINRHGVVGERGAHTLGLISGASGIAPGKNHEELFAAVAPQRIVLRIRSACAGRLAQHGVAGEVAVGVVDALEMVEVHQHHAHGRRSRKAPGQLALKNIEDGGTVPETRQQVAGGLLA